MAMMPRGGIKKDILQLDFLFFVEVLLLGLFPISIISILQQSNTGLVAKTALIIVFGLSGFVMTLALGAVKQQKIRFLSVNDLLKNGTFVVALALIVGTWLSQYIVFAGTGITASVLGIVDVLQAKLFYGSVGVWEELAFGTGLLLTLNNLIDNFYWTIFNTLILNPILFGIYHIFVIGSSIALLYVILPRLLFNLWYAFAAQPSPVILAHFSFNFIISSVAASSIGLSVLSTAFSLPQLNLLSCIAPIGFILWRVLR
jgi:hypothetical protein